MYRYDRKNDKLMTIDTAKPHEMPDVIQYEPIRGVMRGVPKVYETSHGWLSSIEVFEYRFRRVKRR